MFTFATVCLVSTVVMSVRLAVQLALDRSETHARQRAGLTELDRMISGLGCR
jgi:hypothetical protein